MRKKQLPKIFSSKTLVYLFVAYVVLIGSILPIYSYSWLAPMDHAALVSRTASHGLFFLCAVVLISMIEDRWICAILAWLSTFGLVNGVYIFGQWVFGVEAFHRTGFLNNASLSASFTIASLPVILWIGLTPFDKSCSIQKLFRAAFFLFALGVAFASQSSMPFVMTICIGLLWSQWLFGLIAVTAGIVLIPAVFHSSSRVQVWAHAFDFWKSHLDWMLTGSGFGTWFLWFPRMQNEIGFSTGSLFTTAHNDVIQIIFEFGLIGFVLFACIWLVTIRSSLGYLRHTILIALLGCLGNSFLYSFPHCVLLAGLFGLVLKDDTR